MMLEICGNSDNQLSGDPETIGKCACEFRGSGSHVTIGDGCTFYHTRIITGHGSTVTIGEKVQLFGYFWVGSGCKLTIGPGTRFWRPSAFHLGEQTDMNIGEDCLFADVKIRTSDAHVIVDLTTGERQNPAAPVVIRDHVWLAEGVRVLKGVTIGQGSVVAAGSLVTRDIPENCLAAGAPARVVREGIGWQHDLPLGVFPGKL